MALTRYRHKAEYCAWCEEPWHEHEFLCDEDDGPPEWMLFCRPVKGVTDDPDRDHGVRYLGPHLGVAWARLVTEVGKGSDKTAGEFAWRQVMERYAAEHGRGHTLGALLEAKEIAFENLKRAGSGHDLGRCDVCPPGWPAPHFGDCGNVPTVHATIIDKRRDRRLTDPEDWDRRGGLIVLYSRHVEGGLVANACELCGKWATGRTWQVVKDVARETDHWIGKRRRHHLRRED